LYNYNILSHHIISPNVFFIFRKAPESNSQLQLFRYWRSEMFDYFKWHMSCNGLRGQLH